MTYQLGFSGRWLALALAALFVTTSSTNSSAATVRLTIENVGPVGSTFVTPVFAGFHDGSYDLSNGGTATAGLESLAELGMTGGLTSEFLAGDATRVAGTLGGGPLAPGASVTADFVVDLTGNNTRLTLASMVLPSSDYFFGNITTPAFDVSMLSSTPTTFVLSSLYDAGTELNDFTTSPGNGLFPGAGLPATIPTDSVTDTNTNIRLVATGTEFGDFLNAPAGGFNAPLSQLRITATTVPEPSMGFAACLLMGGVVARRRRR